MTVVFQPPPASQPEPLSSGGSTTQIEIFLHRRRTQRDFLVMARVDLTLDENEKYNFPPWEWELVDYGLFSPTEPPGVDHTLFLDRDWAIWLDGFLQNRAQIMYFSLEELRLNQVVRLGALWSL